MKDSSKNIIIKDSTLREGLDVPGVNFSPKQRLKIAKLVSEVGVPQIEIVAPSRVLKDLKFAKSLKKQGWPLATSGLIYACSDNWKEEIKAAAEILDRFDILMPVSPKRKPYSFKAKINTLGKVLSYALRYAVDVGVGFPQATQTDGKFLLQICKVAQHHGARRITVYDTNGSSDPFGIYDLINRIRRSIKVPLFFHAHNDLGLATANSLAAVYAGASGLDTTVNGIGDRAGNSSLEQIALCLSLRGFKTGIKLQGIRRLSKAVEKESGVMNSELAPVVGKHIFSHRSPGHFEKLDLFEAYRPQQIGLKRKVIQ